MIRLIVSGACGKMGKAMLEKLVLEDDIDVVGAIDISFAGNMLADVLPFEKFTKVKIFSDIESCLKETKPNVLLDFTTPNAVYKNVMLALQNGVAPVIGTTGLNEEQIKDIDHLSQEKGLGAFIAPNFAIGAVLLMQLAAQASKYFTAAEIIELHHDQKIDAPSGTALKTIEAMEPYLGKKKVINEIEILPGSRGGEKSGIRVHSVRLPGFVAHQEVIFGALGQTLTIRHDSISRESFYPGVVLAIRKVLTFKGLKQGLETILE